MIDTRQPANPLAQRLATFVVIVAILAIGVSILRPAPELDPTAFEAGRVADFEPGRSELVEITLPFENPTILEGAQPPVTVGIVDSAVAWITVVNDTPMALLAGSPWLGCRVVVATATDAANFGYSVDAGFTGFLDPCHGGLYSITGQHLDGPGSADLTEVPVRIDGGIVLLDLEAIAAP